MVINVNLPLPLGRSSSGYIPLFIISGKILSLTPTDMKLLTMNHMSSFFLMNRQIQMS